MTARRDPESLIQAYLEDGPTELADRSYDAVRAEIDHKRQRVVIGPWRIPSMNNVSRFAIAGVAVLVVVLGGAYLIPKLGGIGGPGASPTPSARAGTPVTEGALAAGTYYADESRVLNVASLTFTLPAGWSAGPVLPPQGSLNEHPAIIYKDVEDPAGLWLETWIVDATFTDICHWRGTDSPVGPSAGDLVTALAAQTGREASAVSDATLGGFPAKRIETVTPDQDAAFCDGGLFNYWPGVGPNPELTGRATNLSNQTDVVYAADVAGNRLVLVASHLPGTSERDLAELDAIVESIQIEP
jgi:hypothetical protein